jgi:hypothetical protein
VRNTWQLGALGFDQSIWGGSKDRNKDPGSKLVPVRGSKPVLVRGSKPVRAPDNKRELAPRSTQAHNNRHVIRADPRPPWMLPRPIRQRPQSPIELFYFGTSFGLLFVSWPELGRILKMSIGLLWPFDLVADFTISPQLLRSGNRGNLGWALCFCKREPPLK